MKLIDTEGNMCGIFAYLWRNGASIAYNIVQQKAKLIQHRGPDETKENNGSNHYFCFHRLSINDLSPLGGQPFERNGIILMCNGEIYNYIILKKKYNIETKGHSDCEILIPLYEKLGPNFVEELDGVFSIVLFDTEKKKIVASRDPIGVRPLFYGKKGKEEWFFSSEWKSLMGLVDTDGVQFRPRNVLEINMENGLEQWTEYVSVAELRAPSFNPWDYETQVRKLMIDAVKKRVFMSDRPIGFLLSGGLDSSLVASIGAKCLRSVNPNCRVATFSIGLEGSQDLVMARKVAKFIGSDHKELVFSVEDGIAVINDVIYCLESYDTTTIRASIPQYLLCKWIKENTDVRVLFSGEGADEALGGYYYFKHVPDVGLINPECRRLIKELYEFDVLRTDRTTASNGLEVRVPFLDLALLKYIVDYVPSEFKRSFEGTKAEKIMEKSIIRRSFKGWLPNEVLWRAKDAFSDSVGRKWRAGLLEMANKRIEAYGDELKDITGKMYGTWNVPRTKEEFIYRAIFEKYYQQCGTLISHFWMPLWTGENKEVNDPSAIVIGAQGEEQAPE